LTSALRDEPWRGEGCDRLLNPVRFHVDKRQVILAVLGRTMTGRAPLVFSGCVVAAAAAVWPWKTDPLGAHTSFLPAILAVVACEVPPGKWTPI
jgi:hypothetical protein